MASIQTQSKGEWALLEAHFPNQKTGRVGILLSDVCQDFLYVRLKSHWWDICPDEGEREIWRELATDLKDKAEAMSSAGLLDWLDSNASHALRISRREVIKMSDAESTLDSLFHQHIIAHQSCAAGPLTPLTDSHGQKRFALIPFLRGGERRTIFSVHNYLTAAVAASFIAGALLIPHRSSRMMLEHAVNPPPNLETDQFSPFPLNSEVAIRSNFLSIDLQAQLPKRRNIRKHEKPSRSLRAGLKTEHLTVLSRPVRALQMPKPPPLELVANVTPVPTSSLPKPPKFKRHRNGVVHVLALIAAPFRILAR